jgi:hypothetical protein
MEYYLLPVGKGKEASEFEEALRRIDYDVDDRDSTWSKEDIDKIISTMTKENATRMILQFLPDPVGDKLLNCLE